MTVPTPRLEVLRSNPIPGLATAALLAAPLLAMLDALALAPLLALLAAAFLAAGGWRRLGPIAASGLDRIQAWLLAMFLAWLVASALWSPDQSLGLKSAAMTLGTVLAGVVVTAEFRRLSLAELERPMVALAFGLAAGLTLLFLVQLGQRWLIDPAGPYAEPALRMAIRMDRGTTFASLLLWPAVVGCRRLGRRRLAWLLPVLAVPAVGLSHDLAAKVGLAVGLAALLSTLVMPRRLAPILGTLMAAGVLLAPTAAQHLPAPEHSIQWTWLPRSAHHRLTIWSFAGRSIAADPLRGRGLEASRRLGGGAHLKLIDPAGQPVDEELMPLHPHDAPLQLWLELGAVGAILTAGFLAWTGRRLAAPAQDAVTEGPPRAAAVATFAVAFLVSCVSYGFWQSWWQSSLWLAAAVAGALLSATAQPPQLDFRSRVG